MTYLPPRKPSDPRRAAAPRAVILLALTLAGCHGAPFAVRSPFRLGATSTQAVTLSASPATNETLFTLSVNGFGHYAANWYVTGIFADSLILHGAYGQEPPASDYLWLSHLWNGRFVYGGIYVRPIVGESGDIVSWKLPTVLVPPESDYLVRVWARDTVCVGQIQAVAGRVPTPPTAEVFK